MKINYGIIDNASRFASPELTAKLRLSCLDQRPYLQHFELVNLRNPFRIDDYI